MTPEPSSRAPGRGDQADDLAPRASGVRDAPPFRDPASAQARFLAEVEPLRGALHRYCTRMMGSPLDGEDVVQDTLAAAFFRLDTLDSSRPLAPLLYRIAHNRCIDGLRRQRFTANSDGLEDEAAEPCTRRAEDVLDHRQQATRALEHLVTELPPRERSCVVLKDVLDLSLDEVAASVGCTRGAVKAALHRGRAKLEALRKAHPAGFPRTHAGDRETLELLQEYCNRFNARDWPALAELLADDLKLDVVGVLEDGTREVLLDRYVVNYGLLEGSFRLEPGWVEGEPVLLCFRSGRPEDLGGETPAWAIRVHVAKNSAEADASESRVVAVRDYALCGPLLGSSRVTTAADSLV